MTSNNEHSISELIPITIEEEMKRSYLDYAMSVIVSRAIPDARDGLKPVHRRILFAMYESGSDWNKPFRKSARIVGEVMGKYHPHGDTAIYDSLVRMAQNFSLRLPLIDGQGNFGSMDGDSPAAMRYTESRLDKAAHLILEDIDKSTVDFQENYDGSEKEPVVLPARFPNLLVNGAGGIAVGMATNIPPHNLGEVIDACCAYIDNNELTVDELAEIVKGPDFPTGGIIIGKSGIRLAATTGRGSIVIRGKTHFEEFKNNRTAIIITEIPYQVNKAKLVERIAELVRDKRVEGISDLRDESDKSGVRVVIEIKRDAHAEIVLNQLYNFTPLQTSFGVNTLALNNGYPQIMNLKQIIQSFIKFREVIIIRRTNFLLSKAKERAHVLLGLLIAVVNINDVIKLIRGATDPAQAKELLMNRKYSTQTINQLITFAQGDDSTIGSLSTEHAETSLTEAQAKAILEMRLQRLTGLEHSKLTHELEYLKKDITYYNDILESRSSLLALMKQELIETRNQFATARRTAIQESEFEYDIEDLIQKEEMVVIVTVGGYIKRVPLSTYRSQKRGGKGRSGLTMHEEDITTELFVASTHTPVLFFSNLGKVYKLKVYKLTLSNAQSKGRSLVNIFPLAEGEKITTLMPLPEDESLLGGLNIMFATAKGNIRRNSLLAFQRVPSNGKIAIKLNQDDKLIAASVCNDDDHILLASQAGKCVRFAVNKVRVFKSRTSDGIRGMKLSANDQLISMSILHGSDVNQISRDTYLKLPKVQKQALADDQITTDLDQQLIDNSNYNELKILAKNEQFILTITENGFGKRSSSHEYRSTNRGGQGIVNIITSERNGKVVASFPVEHNDQLMLMSDKGTLIRCPVADIRIGGRNTQGVMLFKTKKGEVVVSAARLLENSNLDFSQEVLDEQLSQLTEANSNE